jgi:hypothetical protein
MICSYTREMDDNNDIKPVLKRQILFVAFSIGLSLVLTFFIGFLIGIVINMAIFTAVAFYIRRSRLITSKKSGFSGKTIGQGQGISRKGMKLKYLCLVCSSEVSDVTCKTCGPVSCILNYQHSYL